MVLLIAMVVLGPERLPKAARDIGRAIAEFRRITSGVQSDLRDAMGAEEFRESMESLRSVVDLKGSIRNELQGLTSSLTSSISDTSAVATGASDGGPDDVNGPDKPVSARMQASANYPPVNDIPPPDGVFLSDLAAASVGDASVPCPGSGFDDVHSDARAADPRPRLGVLDSYDR